MSEEVLGASWNGLEDSSDPWEPVKVRILGLEWMMRTLNADGRGKIRQKAGKGLVLLLAAVVIICLVALMFTGDTMSGSKTGNTVFNAGDDRITEQDHDMNMTCGMGNGSILFDGNGNIIFRLG